MTPLLPRRLFVLAIGLSLGHRGLAPERALADTGDAVPVMEQIVVTASRGPLPGATLPVSWSRVERDELALTAAVHANEIMQRVPGAWISRGNGQESLTALRSPVLTGAGACGAFAVSWDGLPVRAPGFCNVNQMFDLNMLQADRVEVIRGPAGTAHGSNALHGVIDSHSQRGDRNAWRASVEGGSYGFRRAAVSLLRNEGRHGLSLQANGAGDEGYQDSSGYDREQVTLRHDYEGQRWTITSAFDGTRLDQETAGYITGFASFRSETARRRNPNPEAYRDSWSARAYLRLETDLVGGQTLSITPHWRRARMEFLQHFLPWQPWEKNGHESLGLRAALAGSNAVFDWRYGLDLDSTDGWLREFQPEPFSPNQPQGMHYDYEVEAHSAAGWGQLYAQLGPRWHAMGGARLEHRRYRYDNLLADGSACVPTASACRFFRPSDRSDDFNDWTLNLGITRVLPRNSALWFRIARGFRAPQTSELYRLQNGQSVADVDSEAMDSVEVGLRGDPYSWLSLQATLYHMRKDDVIFQDTRRQVVNGANTRHEGLELSVDARRGPFYGGLDLSWARHRYDSAISLLGSSGDIDGNDIDTSPHLFGSARIGWRAEDGRLRGELEWVHLGDYFLDPDNRFRYGGHDLLNLRLQASLGEHWGLALRTTNLLDEDYAERADFGFGEYRYFVGRPRSVFLELSFRG